MDNPVTNDTTDILYKIKNIEKELVALKLSILKKHTPSNKKIISLKGTLKEVDVSEQDIIDAKKSLYSNIEP